MAVIVDIVRLVLPYEVLLVVLQMLNLISHQRGRCRVIDCALSLLDLRTRPTCRCIDEITMLIIMLSSVLPI